MYYSKKKGMEQAPEEMTAIWSCTNESCNGWMRDNFVLEDQPTCVQCQSFMVKGEKMLAVVTNNTPRKASKG